MDRNAIYKKLDKVTSLPTLPVIAMEVNRMLGDDSVTIDNLSRVIEKDQVIVSKLLRLVNSAFFGMQSKVGSVQEAVILLGFNMVRNVVLALSVIDAFPGKDKIEGFDANMFWKHSIGVAMIGKSLSEKTKKASPDDSFIGGLLHDIGKIVLFQFFPDMFKTVIAAAQDNRITFYEAEKKENYTNHAKIGGYMAKKWRLPPDITEIINGHHVINGALNPDLMIVIHIANVLSNAFIGEEKRPELISEIHPDALRMMKPAISGLNEWLPIVIEEVKHACEFFFEKRA